MVESCFENQPNERPSFEDLSITFKNYFDNRLFAEIKVNVEEIMSIFENLEKDSDL